MFLKAVKIEWNDSYSDYGTVITITLLFFAPLEMSGMNKADKVCSLRTVFPTDVCVMKKTSQCDRNCGCRCGQLGKGWSVRGTLRRYPLNGDWNEGSRKKWGYSWRFLGSNHPLIKSFEHVFMLVGMTSWRGRLVASEERGSVAEVQCMKHARNWGAVEGAGLSRSWGSSSFTHAHEPDPGGFVFSCFICSLRNEVKVFG